MKRPRVYEEPAARADSTAACEAAICLRITA
jgi:hypothetical protein